MRGKKNRIGLWCYFLSGPAVSRWNSYSIHICHRCIKIPEIVKEHSLIIYFRAECFYFCHKCHRCNTSFSEIFRMDFFFSRLAARVMRLLISKSKKCTASELGAALLPKSKIKWKKSTLWAMRFPTRAQLERELWRDKRPGGRQMLHIVPRISDKKHKLNTKY